MRGEKRKAWMVLQGCGANAAAKTYCFHKAQITGARCVYYYYDGILRRNATTELKEDEIRMEGQIID